VAPVYATAEDFRDYVRDVPADTLAVPHDEAIERLLERAERDVDRIAAGPLPPLETGRKFDLDDLTEAQADALKRATCAAAEWRLAMGEAELIAADDGVAQVGGLITLTTRPVERVAPKLREELAGSGLFLYSGTLRPEPEAEAEDE
jgi:hypothetical protein